MVVAAAVAAVEEVEEEGRFQGHWHTGMRVMQLLQPPDNQNPQDQHPYHNQGVVQVEEGSGKNSLYKAGGTSKLAVAAAEVVAAVAVAAVVGAGLACS